MFFSFPLIVALYVSCINFCAFVLSVSLTLLVHLVLWSLGTLTGQQRFYGSGLVT